MHGFSDLVLLDEECSRSGCNLTRGFRKNLLVDTAAAAGQEVDRTVGIDHIVDQGEVQKEVHKHSHRKTVAEADHNPAAAAGPGMGVDPPWIQVVDQVEWQEQEEVRFRRANFVRVDLRRETIDLEEHRSS